MDKGGAGISYLDLARPNHLRERAAAVSTELADRVARIAVSEAGNAPKVLKQWVTGARHHSRRAAQKLRARYIAEQRKSGTAYGNPVALVAHGHACPHTMTENIVAALDEAEMHPHGFEYQTGGDPIQTAGFCATFLDRVSNDLEPSVIYAIGHSQGGVEWMLAELMRHRDGLKAPTVPVRVIALSSPVHGSDVGHIATSPGGYELRPGGTLPTMLADLMEAADPELLEMFESRFSLRGDHIVTADEAKVCREPVTDLSYQRRLGTARDYSHSDPLYDKGIIRTLVADVVADTRRFEMPLRSTG